MIYLARTKPKKLDVCEALLRRAVLSAEHRNIVEEMLLKGAIGYEGECFADQYWQDLRLADHYALLHNLHVSHREKFYHQMDTVFICQKFILIVELKYIAGELYYDEKTNQFWRHHNGQRLALGDPFAQVLRHEMWMSRFLWEARVDIPIVTAVIVTAKSALLGQMPKQFHIFKLDGLHLKLKEWFSSYHDVLTSREVDELAKMLVERHQERDWNWRQHFHSVHLKQGVYCTCGTKMLYRRGSFHCMCGAKERDLHLLALADYRNLVGEWISNSAFRQLVGIESEHAANKILKRLHLEESGKTKLRKYKIPRDIYLK